MTVERTLFPSVEAYRSLSHTTRSLSYLTHALHKRYPSVSHRITFRSLSTTCTLPARRKHTWCDVNQRSRPRPWPLGPLVHACLPSSSSLLCAIYGARVWCECRVRRAPSQYIRRAAGPFHLVTHASCWPRPRPLLWPVTTARGVVGSQLNNRRRHLYRAGPIRRRRRAV